MQLLDPYKKIAVAVAVLSLNACALVAHQSTKTSAPQAAQSAMADSDYRRAVTAAKAGREEDASKLFTAVTKSHPDSAAAYINLGLIELKRDNLHTAKTALVHAAALAPRQPEVYNALGIVYRRLGRFDDAETSERFSHGLRQFRGVRLQGTAGTARFAAVNDDGHHAGGQHHQRQQEQAVVNHRQEQPEKHGVAKTFDPVLVGQGNIEGKGRKNQG